MLRNLALSCAGLAAFSSQWMSRSLFIAPARSGEGTVILGRVLTRDQSSVRFVLQQKSSLMDDI